MGMAGILAEGRETAGNRANRHKERDFLRKLKAS